MITIKHRQFIGRLACIGIIGLLLLVSSNGVMAQERVRAGKAYLAGDTILAPMFGIEMVLPEHWNGFLTRDTEVVTLNADTIGETNVMIFPTEEDLESIKDRWNGKVTLSPGVDLLPVEPPGIVQGKLKTEFNFSGNEDRMGYAIARCGAYGFCYTAFLIVTKTRGHIYKDVLDKLANSITFFEPTLTEYYGDYNWEQVLKGKYMVTYEVITYSAKKNHLWLCPDGTFQARIKRKGGFKGSSGGYKGKLKGTYQVQGVGAKGTLMLNFEKLPPLELPLEVKDDVIYMNGLRYSVAEEHNQCK